MEVKCNALVLRATDYKDNDKILTLFAAGKGKITASCKGVKKGTAKLKFAAQPFCFAEYVLAEKGGRYVVTSAFLHDGFYALREDINKFYAASAVLEICNAVLPENLQSDGLFLSAVKTLGAICEGDEKRPLVDFLLSALSFAGYNVNTSGCLCCGNPLTKRGGFSFEQGGFYCNECAGESAEELTPVSAVTFQTLHGQGLECDKGEGEKRALRLLKEYFFQKIDARVDSLGEYIRLI